MSDWIISFNRIILHFNLISRYKMCSIKPITPNNFETEDLLTRNTLIIEACGQAHLPIGIKSQQGSCSCKDLH